MSFIANHLDAYSLCVYIARMTKQFFRPNTDTNEPRRRTSLTLRPDYLAVAKELDINVSRAAEQGLKAAIQLAQAEQWRQDNHQALDSYNDYLETHGLPLAKHRLF